MKRNRITSLLFVLSIAGSMVLIALYVPHSLPAHSDFSAIYNTDLALVHRVPIYDLEKVEALAVQYADIPPEKFFLARFPYPPWYALGTFYLGWMPARAAALLWFELNLAMLFLSVWLLTDGWTGRMRLTAFLLALFFLPVLGALSVGQYDFPVLLGTSLLIYSLRRENVPLTVLGMVLLTFKPHIGAFILLSAVLWLFFHNPDFGRRVLRPLLAAGGLLVVTGFLADPRWIVSYPGMLLNYQNEGNVSACSECASLPVWLSRWLLDGSLTRAVWIAIILLVLLVGLLFLIRTSLKSPEVLLSAALLATLIASPYLYNYDYLLLLVPFAVLFRSCTMIGRILILLCYLVPTLAILVYGRNGNISLTVAALTMMMILLFTDAKKGVIDFPVRTAYNISK
jgi:hypothetical protein